MFTGPFKDFENFEDIENFKDIDDFEDSGNDRPGGLAEAMRETAYSFEAPASAAMYAGALAQARRHRRRSAAAGTLAAVAVVGVAGAVVTQLPSRGAARSAAGTSAGGPVAASSSSSPSPSPDSEHSSSSAAAATPKPKPPTEDDLKALANFVLNTGMNAMPPGSQIVGHPTTGIMGSKFPRQKRLPVNPPTDVIGGVDGAWDFGPGDSNVGIQVQVRTLRLDCAFLMKGNPKDVCTTTPFAGGGVIVSHQYRKDSTNQTGPYFSDYIWLRPDGADIMINLVASSPARFAWTSAQADAVFALPAWEQAVTRVKAYIDAEGGGSTGD